MIGQPRSPAILLPARQIASPMGLLQSAAAGGDWWEIGGQTVVAAYNAIGAASLADSYINLANPGTYDMTAPVAAPAWAGGTGWTFNGSTTYLRPGITPATDQSWSAIVRFSDATSGYFVGYYNSNTERFSLAYSNPMSYQHGQQLSIGTAFGTGTMGFAGDRAYADGVQQIGTIGAWSGTAGIFYIGARRREDTLGTDGYLNGKIQAIAIYSTTLSVVNINTLTTAMNALS